MARRVSRLMPMPWLPLLQFHLRLILDYLAAHLARVYLRISRWRRSCALFTYTAHRVHTFSYRQCLPRAYHTHVRLIAASFDCQAAAGSRCRAMWLLGHIASAFCRFQERRDYAFFLRGMRHFTQPALPHVIMRYRPGFGAQAWLTGQHLYVRLRATLRLFHVADGYEVREAYSPPSAFSDIFVIARLTSPLVPEVKNGEIDR